MLSSRGREQGRWARLLELSYDTLGYLEQNVSPRLAFEALRAETQRETPSLVGTEYLLTTELVLRESTGIERHT